MSDNNISDIKDKCCGCESCSNRCPYGCIEMKENDEGFLYPLVDVNTCINCGICRGVCPILNSEFINTGYSTKSYIMKNLDDEIRVHSSSGGVFFEIARRIIDLKGVVFGVIIDENGNVLHSYSSNLHIVKQFMQSKYVQSRIDDSYAVVERELNNGKWVLFSGTTCQVQGLLSYLKVYYEKLVTIDLVCHGVPSPKVWKLYLKNKKYKYDCNQQVEFRNKNKGWRDFSIIIPRQNNRLYKEVVKKDLYMRGFIDNLFLRPCCYDCRFKKLERNSDITLADCWGIKKIDPDYDDGKGVSLVIIHSHKGEELLYDISRGFEMKSINSDTALKASQALTRQAQVNLNRDRFFNGLNDVDIEKNIKSCLHKSLIEKIEIIVRKIIIRTRKNNV